VTTGVHCIIRLVAADATQMRRDADGRPLGAHDRHGVALSALEWRPDGRLERARVRVPDGGWITIEPRAGAPGPWGASDLVSRHDEPLTRLAALDWTRVDRIPPLAEPARLPAGAGSAIFNLLAALAREQDVEALRYDGPWPTEALFLTLLESFRFEPADAKDPCAAFASGALTWRPAPHEVAIEREIWVQRRERIEKIVAGGHAYYRPDWQGVRRLAPRAVRDAGETVRASLVALGRVLEDHVVLAADGRVVDMPAVPADPPEVVPLPPVIAAGLLAIVHATSAPALAPWLAAAARELEFAWGPVEADLAATSATRVTLSHRLRRVLAETVRGRDRAEVLALALVALREAADLVGDALRARAQAALAAEPTDVQAAALETGGPPVADARAIAAAADALALAVASG
jgi:hypothetical protein